MLTQVPLLVAQAAGDGHDAGVRHVAQISARLAYAAMCATLCWGVMIATGWANKFTGRQGLRNSHMVLATLALAFGSLHAFAFTILQVNAFSFVKITVPFATGGLFRHALGIIGLEIMLVIAFTAGLRKKIYYRKWLRLHQLAYPAVTITVIHSWFGAIANGNLAVLWLAGLTILIPTVTIALARFLPPDVLVKLGMLEPEPGFEPEPDGAGGSALDVSVDNERCHRYGICQAEAPGIFQLVDDERLRYDRRPPPEQFAKARAAARACPMRAIELRERVR
ncbi:ferredoxin [Saccharothrix coeruleofusca]|uniref:Ferredoxin n=1 Tax=Saccharothrix coeruleofusca TaxID=33919 RepID=A0A918APC0_9PSEU|nr:ferric reductase-like transmembrane domain-containing protein [Saccharothrix coeruleofusca]MBP2337631.1 sulfoxide reductase heme-binding subunit YedZ [Saccharothrix coeruleofusca]GGP64559.1 ferredoxin [Saccharothrix coeruleofusca]